MKNRKHNNVWNESLESHITANKYGDYQGLKDYADNMIMGTISWERFETGTEFARCITPFNNSAIAAEYLTIEAYKEIERISSETNRHIREVWRSSAAVLTKWNPKPKRFVFMRLEQPAYGLVGCIAPQFEEDILANEESQRKFGGGTGAYLAHGNVYLGGAYNTKLMQVLFPHLAKSVKDIVDTKEGYNFDYDNNGVSIKICGHKVIE